MSQTPLVSWSVRGFKSLVDAHVEFRSLTVIAGSNSSGKSSLIQSILLAAQAAQLGSQGALFPLNGPLVSLGGFEDVASAVGAKKARAISFGGLFDLPERRRGRAWEHVAGNEYQTPA